VSGAVVATRNASLRMAAWQPHARAVRAPARMHDWLVTPGSLTARLVASSEQFRVRRVHQRGARCLADEAAAIGLARPQRVWEREVLLMCDGKPAVFGHTVVPLSATASDWPLFSALGERSLGSTLFYDPLVRRGQLEFARLGPEHPLARRVRALTGANEPIYYARRCVYRRRQGLLLVTEVFLPAVLGLETAATMKNTT
jgi:chorismate--pyruvate lyase